MKRYLFLLAVLLPITIKAQVKPEWLNEVYRQSHFPAKEYYTGFSQDKVDAGEQVSAGLDRIKLEARNKLSESIVVWVSGQTEVVGKSYQIIENHNTKESITQEYSQNLSSATQSVLTNLEVKTYFDAEKSLGYAFAFILKSDLESYYSNRIVYLLERAAADQEVATIYQETGNVRQTKEKLNSALAYLENAQSFFCLLAAVNPENTVLREHVKALALYQEVSQSVSRLDKGPSIFITGTFVMSGTEDDAFAKDPHILLPSIAQELSEAKIQIVQDASSADYILELNTSTSLRSKRVNGKGFLSYYANVNGQLINNHTGKEVITIFIDHDPACYATGQTPEQAGLRAFKSDKLKKEIAEIIINNIEL